MKERKHEAPPRYDAAFKEGAIRLVTEEGRPMREVAEELGICTDTIRNWLKASGIQPKETERQNRLERRQRDLEAENRALHIQSARKFAYKRTTNSKHSHPVAPNLLNRNFQVPKPNTVWVGNITYIPTGQGWLYLAIVKDLCTKKVVGYAFSNRIDTALTLVALCMAVKRERPAPGLMIHSDRGVQYAAAAYREELEKLGCVQSMSRKGEPHDTAVAENFFSCLKCELVYLTSYVTRRQAQNSIFRYIEGFYNPVRPHSSIGWLSPMEYARQLNRQNVA